MPGKCGVADLRAVVVADEAHRVAVTNFGGDRTSVKAALAASAMTSSPEPKAWAAPMAASWRLTHGILLR